MFLRGSIGLLPAEGSFYNTITRTNQSSRSKQLNSTSSISFIPSSGTAWDFMKWLTIITMNHQQHEIAETSCF